MKHFAMALLAFFSSFFDTGLNYFLKLDREECVMIASLVSIPTGAVFNICNLLPLVSVVLTGISLRNRLFDDDCYSVLIYVWSVIFESSEVRLFRSC